jgi:glutathione peroxidase
MVSAQEKTFYDFTVKTIDEGCFHLTELKGKVVLLVNTASRCGLTPQYASLQALYDRFKEQNFEIIGFPANNFKEQEPGTNAEIYEFCTVNYGVTFPMMAKISVAGDDIAPLYKWLTTKDENGVLDAKVSWNFQKFLIDANGRLTATFAPKQEPLSEEIVSAIEQLLHNYELRITN